MANIRDMDGDGVAEISVGAYGSAASGSFYIIYPKYQY
ncbi:hypothetical protein ACFL35_20420 [Candidatus Riflebacteria bacterium]